MSQLKSSSYSRGFFLPTLLQHLLQSQSGFHKAQEDRESSSGIVSLSRENTEFINVKSLFLFPIITHETLDRFCFKL